MKKKFNISALSQKCGVKPHTIRVWESRYEAFRPERTTGGQRLYSLADIEKAQILSRLVSKGFSISTIAKESMSKLRSLDEDKVELKEFSTNVKSNLVKLLFYYVRNFNLEGVEEELKYLRSTLGIKDFIYNVVLVTLRDLGELVVKEKLSVTQEHIVSTLIRDQLKLIDLPNNNSNKTNFALTTADGNSHELSIMIADIICRYHRYNTIYLGASNPSLSLANALNKLKPTYLIIGSVSSEKWSVKRDLLNYLNEIDQGMSKSVKIIVGGSFEELDLVDVNFKNIKEVRFIKTYEDLELFLENL